MSKEEEKLTLRLVIKLWASLVSQTVKNLPANAEVTGAVGLISGLGRSCGEGNGNPSSTLAWRIPWTEEPGRLQSMGLQRVKHNLVTEQQQQECFGFQSYALHSGPVAAFHIL